jgi:hypothetical protein
MGSSTSAKSMVFNGIAIKNIITVLSLAFSKEQQRKLNFDLHFQSEELKKTIVPLDDEKPTENDE